MKSIQCRIQIDKVQLAFVFIVCDIVIHIEAVEFEIQLKCNFSSQFKLNVPIICMQTAQVRIVRDSSNVRN